MKRSMLTMYSALLAVFVLAACAPAAAPSPTAPPPPTTAAAVPTQPPATAAPLPTQPPAATAKPQSLVIAQVPPPAGYDPGRIFEGEELPIAHNTYSTLVTYEHGDVSQVKPDLSTSWKISTDGKEFTFDLRPNVKFASGNPVTAADVVWSFNRLKNLKGNPAFMMDQVAKVEATGDLQVKVTLSDPDSAFLARITAVQFSVLDSKLVAANGGDAGPNAATADKAASWLTYHSAGSGPLVISEFKPDVSVTLTRNPNYYKGPAKLDKITFLFVKESASQRLQLERGDVDMAFDLSPEDAAGLVGKAGVKVASKPGILGYFLSITMDPKLSEPLSKPTVQTAIKYAIDYDGLLKLVPGGAVHPPTVVPLGMLGSATPDMAFKRDLVKAKQLLADAGYPSGFKCTLTYNTGRAYKGLGDEVIVQKIQKDLADVGITVALEPLDNKVELTKERAGELAFIPKSWEPDWPDVGNVLISFQPGGSFAKRMHWDADMDKWRIRDLVTKGLAEPNPQKKANFYLDAQKLIIENGPYVSLFIGNQQIGIRDRLNGFDMDPWWILNGFEVSF